MKDAARKLADIVNALEEDLEDAVTTYLELDGWRSLKTDPVCRRDWGKGFGELGMADHLYLRYDVELPPVSNWIQDRALAQVLWIEFKRIRPGRRAPTKLTTAQRIWHEAERARGALTLVAGVDFGASLDDFSVWYLASGLNRRHVARAR